MTIKKKKFYLIILFFLTLSVLSIFPYFTKHYIFMQDDLIFHRTRLESYYRAVTHLDFFPRVFSTMGMNFGYGADMFYPSILLLPFALFRFIGLSFVPSYYLYQLLISFLTAIISFYTLYSLKKATKQALLFSCLYTLSTYRLIDQSVRAAFGETLAFTFLPLFMLAVYTFFYQENPRWKLLAISVSLLIASHLITAFYAVLFLFFFSLIQWKKWSIKRLCALIQAGFVALGLSLWFLLPYLEQTYQLSFNFSKAVLWSTGLNFTMGELLLNSLSNISAPFSDLKPNMGILLLITVILAIANYKKLSLTNKKITIMTVFFMILCTNLFIWSPFKTSIFAIIQFPWRLLIFVSYFACILAVQLLEQFQLLSTKNFLILFGICSFFTLGFNWYNLEHSTAQNNLRITQANVTTFYDSEIGHGKEYLVKDTNYQKAFSSPTLLALAKQATHTYSTDSYTLTTKTTGEQLLPKFYYKGYLVKDNGKVINNYNKDGLVAIRLKAGQHTLRISYKKTVIQKLSVWCSVIVWCLVGLSCFLPLQNNYRKKAKI